MQVGNVMSPVSAVMGPEHTLRQAAARMVQHNTGAAIVMDPALPGPHVITERDLLHAVADGLDVDTQLVGDHMNNARDYRGTDVGDRTGRGVDGGPRRAPRSGI